MGTYSQYAFLVMLLLFILLLKVKSIKYNKPLTLVLLLFVFTTAMSALFNSELKLLFNSFMFLLLFLSGTLVVASFLGGTAEKKIATTIILSHIPIILIPLFIEGIDYIPYSGVFHNPNTLGVVAASLFVIPATTFLSRAEKILIHKEKTSKIALLINFLVLILFFTFVVLTRSRTAFLTILIIILGGILFLLWISIKSGKLVNVFIKTLISLPIIGIIYVITTKMIPVRQYVDEYIINKFQQKSSNILDGRGYAWSRAMNEAGLFGNGERYFINEVGLGSHNTFMNILGIYGWIPMIVFVVFIILSLYFCVRYTVNSKGNFKYLPLMTLLGFIASSMGENVLFQLGMVASFILIGVIANNTRVTITS